MRIVWKDSSPKLKKAVKYRGYMIDGYGDGWITTIPGDMNVYRTHYCALNAIDKHLGGHGQMGAAKTRIVRGIHVIGKKGGDNSCA